MSGGLGIKLAIRTDRETGFARAYVATLDGNEATELGSIRLKVLDSRGGPFFQRWKELMRDAMKIAIKQSLGIDAEEWTGDLDPADLEEEPQA